mmetsp:Transcript_4855/g.12164  ORF Transcript_4855/g.12164 Transcript_4855/m.12164 type:complete len:224 (-) Transcript_4855:209-880(-)
MRSASITLTPALPDLSCAPWGHRCRPARRRLSAMATRLMLGCWSSMGLSSRATRLIAWGFRIQPSSAGRGSAGTSWSRRWVWTATTGRGALRCSGCTTSWLGRQPTWPPGKGCPLPPTRRRAGARCGAMRRSAASRPWRPACSRGRVGAAYRSWRRCKEGCPRRTRWALWPTGRRGRWLRTPPPSTPTRKRCVRVEGSRAGGPRWRCRAAWSASGCWRPPRAR